ncbi:22.7 kDa class IV heat shock protein isoform X2 [Hevea brasiliensis]|uniref:22.7 kDa class IV heat shock protein isoform X2 n=1 Tax=Hevea brasiliensis TaxID=3981 RepID=UPI0025D45117|nr:22.7 kDa class IV heat shock protein isoform X2 [Hevea brasiliensis]
METEAVRRRVNTIAAHFTPTDDISPTHLFPMNCSSSLNSVIPRRDNRVYFARQGSASHAFFMRQASTEQPGVASKCSASEAPLFSRPTGMYEHQHENKQIQSPLRASKSALPAAPTLPNFARPSSRIGRKKQHFLPQKKIYSPQRVEWSPRMDVAESERSYVLTVEIPGVDVNDIRVEINKQNLLVMGKRSTQGCYLEKSISAYHKREILQGPYQVVWPLPSNVDRDSVSAEFLNGILQIIIPKL